MSRILLKRWNERIERVEKLVGKKIPPGSIVDIDDFRSDKVEDCTCSHIACCCRTVRRHKENCKFRRAVTLAVGIECEHGWDVCPHCDPCQCNEKEAKETTVDPQPQDDSPGAGGGDQNV